MGGGYYSGDVGERSRSTSTEHFVHTARQAEKPPEERKCHRSLLPKGAMRECCDNPEHPNTTPIAVLLDVTRSRGKDPKTIFGKLPMFIGQIHLHNLVSDPEILFVAIGDATCDRAPIQLAQYESDNRLDTHLANIWIEEGGGGTGQESYQLGAYALARHTKLDCLKRKKKGVAFIFGDEQFYPVVDKGEVKQIFGDALKADIPTPEIFVELQKMYDTYLIFPRKSWKERKADIDAEIKQRLDDAGGKYLNCEIRFSLIWNNRNDLDLHVTTPAGVHIWYGSKRAPCGGELDVDRNVHGETTKPVENTRWERGVAKRGQYKVWVENYAFHESSHAGTGFKVEIEINGKIETFEGKTEQSATGSSSRVDVGTFFYDPAEREQDAQADKRYEAYDDDNVKALWATVLPSEHILMIDDPKAAVDIMLGVLAITSGAKKLDEYLEDMKEREQTDERINQVRSTLANLAELVGTKRVNLPSLAHEDKPARKRAASQRL